MTQGPRWLVVVLLAAAGAMLAVTDVGYTVGTRGETVLRVIVTNDGRVINAFPVKAG